MAIELKNVSSSRQQYVSLLNATVKGNASVNSATGKIYEKDYEKLTHLPQINDVTLLGNKSFEDLGAEELSALDVVNLWEVL